MSNEFRHVTELFINEWKNREESSLVSFVITGGGFSILDIGKVPGSSGVLSSAFIPYGTADTIKFAEHALEPGESNPLLDDSIKFVGPEATELYSKALLRTTPYTEVVQVVINASLTTTRWRRGKNEAYIWIRDVDGIVTQYHYEIEKITENQYKELTKDEVSQMRLDEDQMIAGVVMSLLLEPKINPAIKDNESLTIIGEHIPCEN